MRSYDDTSGIAVIRAPRENVRMVWTALTFLTKINKMRVIATVRCNAGSERMAAKQVAKLSLKRLAEATLP